MAATRDVARLLLARALDATGNAPVQITVSSPAGCPAAHALLDEFGFVGRKDRLRMERGEKTDACRAGLAQYGTTPYLAT